MRKLVALGLAAAGVVWAINRRSDDDRPPADAWAAGTDRL